MKHKARKTMRILAVGMVLLAVCTYNSVVQAKDTELSHAVLENDVCHVKALLDAGADVNVKVKGYYGNEYTALDYAKKYGQKDIVKLLRKAK